MWFEREWEEEEKVSKEDRKREGEKVEVELIAYTSSDPCQRPPRIYSVSFGSGGERRTMR